MKSNFVHQIIEQQAIALPDQIAVKDGNGSVSYRQLNRQANQLANLLVTLGVTSGTIVAVLNIPNIRLISAMVGILKTGGIYMPLDWGFSEKRLQQVLGQTFHGYLIINQEDWDAVQTLIKKHQPTLKYIISIDKQNRLKLFKCLEDMRVEIQLMLPSEVNPQVALNPDDGNYIFYTSGSTGEGKAILGCHKSIAHYMRWAIRDFQIDIKSKIAHLSQAGFDASIKETLMALCTGGTLIIPPPVVKENIVKLVEWIETQEISIMVCIPSIFRLIIKTIESRENNIVFPALKIVMLSGEMLYAKDIHNWRKIVGNSVQLVNLYGTTETTIIDTFYRINEVSDNPGQIIPAGYPIDNTFVIVANHGRLCKIGETGEIFIKNSYPTKGYFNNEKLTNEAFIQNPLVTDRKDIVYKTGDIGRYLPDRCLEVLGRKDNQVKINGIRIELNEIQQAALSLPGINEVLVMVRKDKNDQNDLICYFTSDSIENECLRNHFVKTLNRNVVPSHIIKMAAFPLNMNGKVDRKMLPDPCDLTPDPDYQPPENDIEVKLVEIWKEVLSLDQIGRNVSFFSTGGNSLRAMQLISAVYKAFEVNLNIRQLFKQATIASLAELIAESTRVKFETISLAAWQPEYALSPAQKSMWLDILIKKNQQAYHMQVAYTVNGYLDVDILRRVFYTIIRRNESLRTVFVSRNGEPKQVILDFDQVIAHQPFVDLTILFYTQKQVQEMIGADFNHAFDLENGPLIRVKLAKLEKQKHVLILTLHHLIADGWSLEVIRKDIFELYHKFRSGNYDLLPALPLQYKDYSEWHLERETSADYQEDKQFWSAYLAPPPALPQLPFGLPMVQSQKFIGDEIVFQFHPIVVKKLRKVAEDHQATVFMVLLTAINVLIYRHTGQPDIIVGSPVSGREEQIWNDQIGLFVNMLAIRNRIDDERTLSQTLEKVKSALLDVYAHQKYPYESVVRDLQTESDQKQAALFEIVVAMFSENNIENQPKDMVIEEIKTSNDTARYNLAFHFYERNDGISACIEFNSVIMSKKSVQCLIDHLLIVIDLMSQDNALVISEIRLGGNDFGKSGKVEMTLDI